MKDPNYNLYIGIVQKLSEAPDSQLSNDLRDKCKVFIKNERSEVELYDFLDSISKQPLTEVNQFVKSLCNVNRFYERPITS